MPAQNPAAVSTLAKCPVCQEMAPANETSCYGRCERCYLKISHHLPGSCRRGVQLGMGNLGYARRRK